MSGRRSRPKILAGTLLCVALAGGAMAVGGAAGAPSVAQETGTVRVVPGINGDIVFDRYVSGGGPDPEIKKIMSMSADGENLTRLVRNGSDPAWSPNGRKVAFVRGGDIYKMDADGSSVVQLTTGGRWEQCPAWSPDGDRIVYSRSPEKYSPIAELFTMNPKGDQVVRLTKSEKIEEDNPAWSPDGMWIAFDNEGAVYKMRSDGTDRTKLVPRTNSHLPNWSPDGEQIVFERGWRIYAMTAAGEDVHEVSQGDLGGGGPAFSPDGTAIVFAAYTEAGEECEEFGCWLGIYRMAPDGSDPVQLTVGGDTGDFGVNDSRPDWQAG